MLEVLLIYSSPFLNLRNINGFDIVIDECLPKCNKYLRIVSYLCVVVVIINPEVKQEERLIRYHKFDVESNMHNVNNLLHEIFHICSGKFNSFSLFLCSSSSRTFILLHEEYDDLLGAISNDTSLIDNNINSYLFTPILSNMLDFDILEF